MQDKLKVLLLVAEPWRMDDGGGNTMNNFFEGMDVEFAQIYCSSKMPDNKTCFRYYQMTDGMVVRAFGRGKAVVGNILNGVSEKANQTPSDVVDIRTNNMLNIIKKIHWHCFITAKNIIWRYCKWRTPELRNFILEFAPDVIYAPCYASPFQLALTRYVKELTGKKIVTWSADDTYSLRQFSLSPFFWFNRIWNRKCLRKTYPYYDSFYSISEDEIADMESVVGQKMKILRKGIELGQYNEAKQTVNDPIKMIYAGGVYIQRWKTLKKIGQALSKINRDGVKMRLDIYTQNQLSKRQKRALDDGQNIFVHKAVSADELKKLYSESDIAIHCESFALQNKLLTRLSFSTKIIDCLASGCAVLAVAWKEQTGLKYLQSQDAAICITELNDLEQTLERLTKNPDLILQYAKKARNCGENNHNIKDIRGELYQEFLRLSKSD